MIYGAICYLTLLFVIISHSISSTSLPSLFHYFQLMISKQLINFFLVLYVHCHLREKNCISTLISINQFLARSDPFCPNCPTLSPFPFLHINCFSHDHLSLPCQLVMSTVYRRRQRSAIVAFIVVGLVLPSSSLTSSSQRRNSSLTIH